MQKSRTVHETDGALIKRRKRETLESRLSILISDFLQRRGDGVPDGFGKLCLYSLSNDWTAESTPFSRFVVESCSCPLCVVTGAHLAIFQLRNVSKKCY